MENDPGFYDRFERDPLGALRSAVEEIFGDSIENLKGRFGFVEGVVDYRYQRDCAAELIHRHPELLKLSPADFQKNITAIGQRIEQMDVPLTAESVAAAYALLKEEGTLVLPKGESPAKPSTPQPGPPTELGDLYRLAEKDPKKFAEMLYDRGLKT